MSHLSEYAQKVSAKLKALKTKIEHQHADLKEFQAGPGTLSKDRTAALDDLVKQSTEIVADLNNTNDPIMPHLPAPQGGSGLDYDHTSEPNPTRDQYGRPLGTVRTDEQAREQARKDAAADEKARQENARR
jgi:hypothetical protein